eukprot:TRINITY_DN24944_c0_g2_i1.p1 TRINITY_DN24944_c0_g2~~TRINITY_DN24944_c0_g2_i1.p1  ORF type:complete len:412 (-),score=69.22 TRINITY_DN24944_c0_g2_i1:119-1354(-)
MGTSASSLAIGDCAMCVKRRGTGDPPEDPEQENTLEVEALRERVLTTVFFDACDEPTGSVPLGRLPEDLSRSFSVDEMGEIEAFRQKYMDADKLSPNTAPEPEESQTTHTNGCHARESRTRFYTLEEANVLGLNCDTVRALQDRVKKAVNKIPQDTENPQDSSQVVSDNIPRPWGVPGAAGSGDANAWCSSEPSSYIVRGPKYLSDRKKCSFSSALGDLVSCDLFMSPTDIPRVAESTAAGTVHRLRQAGEKRQLILLNFRIVPLHFVCVFAVHELVKDDAFVSKNASALIHRFISSMSDDDRRKKLKVIPRVHNGPWLVRKALGENTPAIFGKNVPCTYHSGPDYLEVSVAVAASATAQRVARVLVYAAKAVDVELAILVEGQEADDLPEHLLSTVRIRHPDIGSLRTVS